MAACSKCSTDIPASAIVAGKYKKIDGKSYCLACAGTLGGGGAAAGKPARPSAPARRAGPPAKPASRKPAGGGRPAAGRSGSRRSPAAGGRGEKPAPKRRREPVERHYEAPDENSMDPTTKMAMIAAGVLLVGALIAVFLIKGKVTAEADAYQAKIDASKGAIQAIDDLAAKEPLAFDKIIALIEETKKSDVLMDAEVPEIEKRLSETVSRKNRHDFETENQTALDKLTKTVDDPSQIDDNSKLAKNLLEASVGMDEAFKEKARGIYQKVLDNKIKFMVDDVNRYRENNPEDLKGLLDTYYTNREKLHDMMVPTMSREMLKKISQGIRQLRSEEYDLAIAHDQQVREQTNWVDLLSSSRAGNWKTAGPVTFKFEGNQLIAESTEGHGSKLRGNLISSTRDRWIDFVIEMDVTIESAGFIFLGRYSGKENFFQLSFETGGDGNPIKDGMRYKITVDAIGGRSAMGMDEIGPNGEVAVMELAVPEVNLPAVAKAGAFGVGVNPGGKLIFHSIRAKVIREVP